jgi:hypothetical protein
MTKWIWSLTSNQFTVIAVGSKSARKCVLIIYFLRIYSAGLKKSMFGILFTLISEN